MSCFSEIWMCNQVNTQWRCCSHQSSESSSTSVLFARCSHRKQFAWNIVSTDAFCCQTERTGCVCKQELLAGRCEFFWSGHWSRLGSAWRSSTTNWLGHQCCWMQPSCFIFVQERSWSCSSWAWRWRVCNIWETCGKGISRSSRLCVENKCMFSIRAQSSYQADSIWACTPRWTRKHSLLSAGMWTLLQGWYQECFPAAQSHWHDEEHMQNHGCSTWHSNWTFEVSQPILQTPSDIGQECSGCSRSLGLQSFSEPARSGFATLQCAPNRWCIVQVQGGPSISVLYGFIAALPIGW